MKKITLITLASLIFSISSCTSKKSFVDLEHRFYSSQPSEKIEKSFFNSKEATISEDAIKKILDGKLILKDSLRIALFNCSNTNRFYTNNENELKSKQTIVEKIRKSIQDSKKVQSVFLLPSIIANANSSITNLRESAVRLQADLLLVFSTKSDTYTKYKTFKPNMVKAFATTEIFVMDTRTGIIPFTAIKTNESNKSKTNEQYSMLELKNEAKQEATLKTVEAIGIELYKFLK